MNSSVELNLWEKRHFKAQTYEKHDDFRGQSEKLRNVFKEILRPLATVQLHVFKR